MRSLCDLFFLACYDSQTGRQSSTAAAAALGAAADLLAVLARRARRLGQSKVMSKREGATPGSAGRLSLSGDEILGALAGVRACPARDLGRVSKTSCRLALGPVQEAPEPRAGPKARLGSGAGPRAAPSDGARFRRPGCVAGAGNAGPRLASGAAYGVWGDAGRTPTQIPGRRIRSVSRPYLFTVRRGVWCLVRCGAWAPAL